LSIVDIPHAMSNLPIIALPDVANMINPVSGDADNMSRGQMEYLNVIDNPREAKPTESMKRELRKMIYIYDKINESLEIAGFKDDDDPFQFGSIVYK
jgi:hypothetical protein